MGWRRLDINDDAMSCIDEVIGRIGKEGRLTRGPRQPRLRVGQGKGAGGRLVDLLIVQRRKILLCRTAGLALGRPVNRLVTFDLILKYSRNCKFKDCTHTNEIDCSVIEAVERGEIDRASYDNYMKMEKEKAFFESSVAERRKKDKSFGKMLKNYKKDMDKNRD